jgi:glycosyltransferase involved in cell wall biosynthesis
MPSELSIATDHREMLRLSHRDGRSKHLDDRGRGSGKREGLRVLHVIDRLTIGGTQNLLIRSLGELERRGVSAHVCVLACREQTDDCYCERTQATYLNFPGDYRHPRVLMQCVRRLKRVIDDLQPDIVHSYLWVSDVVAALACRSGAAVHVSHIVDRRDWQASNRLVHRLRRWFSRRAFRQAGTRFIAVSEAARDFACQHMAYARKNVTVAANGIDWDEFATPARRAEPARPLILGAASRLAEEKGHRFLIEAVARLVKRGCDIRLVVTGEGPLRSELESLVAKWNLTQHVEFVGWVTSVRDFYQSVDVFLVPSINAEGLPTTILEAMASGCVVVATDIGGAAEAIRDGVDGCLVPPRSVDALVACITRLTRDRQAMRQMAESARRRIQAEFTTQRMVDLIVQTYLAAIETRPTS